MGFLDWLADHHKQKAQENAYLAQQTGNAIYQALAVSNANNYERAARVAQNMNIPRR